MVGVDEDGGVGGVAVGVGEDLVDVLARDAEIGTSRVEALLPRRLLAGRRRGPSARRRPGRRAPRTPRRGRRSHTTAQLRRSAVAARPRSGLRSPRRSFARARRGARRRLIRSVWSRATTSRGGHASETSRSRCRSSRRRGAPPSASGSGVCWPSARPPRPVPGSPLRSASSSASPTAPRFRTRRIRERDRGRPPQLASLPRESSRRGHRSRPSSRMEPPNPSEAADTSSEPGAFRGTRTSARWPGGERPLGSVRSSPAEPGQEDPVLG